MIKLILFDLDNTLYPTSKQVLACRKAAIKSMIKNGLKGKEKELLTELFAIVKELGSNNEKHFDTLIERNCNNINQIKKEYIIGKGITAYSLMKEKTMILYPDTNKTLTSLLNKGYYLGILTDGIPVKQWDKINRLKLEKYFNTNVWITNNKTKGNTINEILKNFELENNEAAIVGDRKKSDIQAAINTGLTSIQLLKGPYTKEEGPKPDYVIKNLSDILSLSFIRQTPYINA